MHLDEIIMKNTYRDVITSIAKGEFNDLPKINFAKISELIGIPSSYLSRVMKGDADLNPDQLYKLCEFLSLPQKYEKFLFLLLEYDRSSYHRRKSFLLEEIEFYRAEHLKTENYVPQTNRNDLLLREYYSSIELVIVHMALAIPLLQTNPELIVQYLPLTKSTVDQAIKKLTELEVITFSDNKYSLLLDWIHIPPEHELFQSWQRDLRNFSLNKKLFQESSEDLNLSTLTTMSHEDFHKIKKILLSAIKQASEVVKKSQPEKLIQINLDVQEWV